MKYADSTVPMWTSHIVPACSFSGMRPHPKIQMPRKVDSRKNARSASKASGCAEDVPTKRE